jgi:hypothetical protein
VVPIVHHAGTPEVLYNLQALAAFVTVEIRSNKEQAWSQGRASECIAPTWNLQSIKDKHADQPAKNVRQPSACIIAPWMGTNHFQQCIYAQDVLGNVAERVM